MKLGISNPQNCACILSKLHKGKTKIGKINKKSNFPYVICWEGGKVGGKKPHGVLTNCSFGTGENMIFGL